MPFSKDNPGRGRPPLTPDNIDAYLDKAKRKHNGFDADRFRMYIDHTEGQKREVSWKTLAELMHVSNYTTVQKWANLIKQKDKNNATHPKTSP